MTGERAAQELRRLAGRSCAGAVLVGWMLGCTPTTSLHSPPEQPVDYPRVGTTQGSAVAVTQSGRVAIVTNRSDGIVSILHLDPARPLDQMVLDTQRTELAFGARKPWAAVIDAHDNAYVLLRGSSEVVKIAGISGPNPHEDGRADVGSEPTAIVISPSGRRIFVANSADGSISVILTQTLESVPLYLNKRLVDAGFLGPAARDRPGLAHPRALAITDNGDSNDQDETLYATEFFSQPLADATASDPDRNRQGIVYPIDSGGHAPMGPDGKEIPLISLAAVETGFNDAEDKPTGCFPNQLYGAAVQGNRLFVTSVCASPAGPVEAGPMSAPALAANNFKTLSHGVVFQIDTTTNMEVSAPLVLTKQLTDLYASDQPAPATEDQRMALIPNEIVMAPASDGQALVSALGASAVFPIHFDAAGAGVIGAPGARYISLADTTLPIGMAILPGQRALVLDENGRGLATVDLASSKVVAWTSTVQNDWSGDPDNDPAKLMSSAARRGRRLFATGLGAWSFQGQGWSSCESCHPEGLSDGVTWRFTRGPRRSISLAGTYYGSEPQRRMLLWTANIDEVHDVEAIARNLSGGVGGIVWDPYALEHPHTNCRLIYNGAAPASSGTETLCAKQKTTTDRLDGLNGSLGDKTREFPADGCAADQDPCDTNASDDWDSIDAFIRTIRAPRAPSALGSVDLGRQLFQSNGCTLCHSGPGWTLSRVFYEPGLKANGAVPSANPADPSYVPDAAALLGQLRTRTYQVPSSLIMRTSALQLTFRTAVSDTPSLLDNLYAKPPLPDQINCVLRTVGTFGTPVAPDFLGLAPAGAPQVREVRRIVDGDVYADKLATGQTGFNIPSLLGVAAGAPYFHAGNARTLEEVFDPAFIAHSGGRLTPDEQLAVVDFLLSIDEDTQPFATPTDGADLCQQFVAQGP